MTPMDPATPEPTPWASPDPPSPPPQGSETPPKRRGGIYLAAAAALLAVAIAAIAVNSSDDAAGQRSTPQPPATDLPRSTIVASDVAAQPATISGDPLPTDLGESSDPALGRPLPRVEGRSFDEAPVAVGNADVDGAGDPSAAEPTVVVVMAHWCPHCQAEIPRIVDAYSRGELPLGVRVVGVATANDPLRGNFPPAAWLRRESWPFATMVDDEDGSVSHALGVTGFPTLIAVDADGKVALRASGEQTREELIGLWTAALRAITD